MVFVSKNKVSDNTTFPESDLTQLKLYEVVVAQRSVQPLAVYDVTVGFAPSKSSK